MSDQYHTLRHAFPYCDIDPEGFLNWDTHDTERAERWDMCAGLQEDLAYHGWRMDDPYCDNNTIQGQLVRAAP